MSARQIIRLLAAAGTLVSGCPAWAASATFDFDTGTPALGAGQNAPFDQTSGGVTAHFSASSGSFSVQNAVTAGLTLSQFFGNFLYPNTPYGVAVIQFNAQVSGLTLDFATAEQTPIENPTPIRLTAYTNSTQTPSVGSTVLAGTYYGANTLPQGTLTFSATTPFDLVTINIEPGGATGFLLDNIVADVIGPPRYTITTSASPTAGGTTSGDGAYTNGATVTVTATANPGYAFVNWTEAGASANTNASFTFTVGADRTLVAHFSPRLTTSLTSTGVVVAWPASAAGYVLERNPLCATAGWTGATNPVSVLGDQNQVVMSPATGNAFLRLFHP